MKVLTAKMVTESLDWYKDKGDDYVKYDGKHLHYTHPEAARFTVDFPEKIERLPFLAHCLSTLGYDVRHFGGAEIWFTDTGIWDMYLEGIGYQILEAINTAAGQPMSFGEACGYDFRADELVKTLGVLIQPMVFGWDAYYLPRGCSEYFLQVSHHSCVDVHTRTKQFHDEAIKELVGCEFDLLASRDQMISRYLSKSDLSALGKSEPDPSAIP